MSHSTRPSDAIAQLSVHLETASLTCFKFSDVPAHSAASVPQLEYVTQSRSWPPVAHSSSSHRLGAILAESGLCREIGRFRDAALFAHARLVSRRLRCKSWGVQICTRVRNGSARFCGVLQTESVASWTLQHRVSATLTESPWPPAIRVHRKARGGLI